MSTVNIATPPAAGNRSYHHGNLPAVLLAVAELILERDGIPHLTLRAAAREAGVSHAAPANHFRDLTGLLSELAAVGYQRFVAALTAAMDAAGTDPPQRMAAMGRAYVAFARQHPNLFRLMFRNERLDPARPALRAAIRAAQQTLHDAVAAHAEPTPAPLEAAARAVAAWSLVHGFATLLLDGRLDATITALPEAGTAEALLAAVMQTVRLEG